MPTTLLRTYQNECYRFISYIGHFNWFQHYILDSVVNLTRTQDLQTSHIRSINVLCPGEIFNPLQPGVFYR